MSNTKFFYIVIFSVLMTGCSLCPWQTIKFLSYPIETLSEIENFDEIDSNCKIEDVFFYFISNGIEDTMYTTKSPYSLDFVFESYKKETVIINSVKLEFDGKTIILKEDLFPLNVTIDFPNYVNSNIYSGSYKTDYLYELEKFKEIKVIANVTIFRNGKTITKNIMAVADKKVKRGIIQ